MTEVKLSACELLRLKNSGLSADTDDNKPSDKVKQRGPTTWPGDSPLSYLPIYVSLSFYCLS